MVFSFFKKQPQKMPERPMARPRAPLPEVAVPKPPPEEIEPLSEPLPDLEFTTSNIRPPAADAPAVPENPAAPARSGPLEALEFDDFDKDFTESSVMAIDVENGGDPLQADIEQVVVLFANGQDAVARSLLEGLIESYPPTEGQRFWHLLLDLLQVLGERAAFDKLCVDYAKTCETSPPAWRDCGPAASRAAPGRRAVSLGGVLTADNAEQIDELAAAVQCQQGLTIDLGKLIGCDDDVASRLAALMETARRRRSPVNVLNADGFVARLGERLPVGEPAHEASWLLLLELLQRVGTQESFEERAVNYAVTFELSPPSWEAPAASPPPAAGEGAAETSDGAFYLSGELKNCHFKELLPVLDSGPQPVLDFSGVRRLDFFSAGQLVNRLAPFKLAGKEIVIRSPNHLVAELMAVVGLNKQARIIVPKS